MSYERIGDDLYLYGKNSVFVIPNYYKDKDKNKKEKKKIRLPDSQKFYLSSRVLPHRLQNFALTEIDLSQKGHSALGGAE